MTAADIRRELQRHADAEKKAFFPRFFKCGPGEYGEGDVFIGVTVPIMRTVAKTYQRLPLQEIERLLEDDIHELRLTGLLILTYQYEKGDKAAQRAIVRFYLSHLKGVNNWDLVDVSAYSILGAYAVEIGDTSTLDALAKTNHLWKQRIAIVATLAFIRTGNLRPTFRIAARLLNHKHDLIHKAVGWMLREAGKRDEKALRAFLDTHVSRMPRTMLRYAIERFDDRSRKDYMSR